MVRVLTEADIETVLDLDRLVDAVAEGLKSQAAGEVERPERITYPVGPGVDGDAADGTALVMPAHIHDRDYFVTKLVGHHEGNPDHGKPTIHAQLVVADAATGAPAAFMDGALITGARTGCIGAAAVEALVDGPITVGVIGAGTQARWHARAIDTVADVSRVRIYSPSESRHECATDLTREGITSEAVATPHEAVDGADVVVTATTSHEPVFPAAALADDAVVVAVGAYTSEMQELEAAVVERAQLIIADVPDEVATIGDILHADVDPASLVHLGALLAGDVSPPDAGPVVVESVGTAVTDAAAAELLLETAIEADVGMELEF